MPTNVDRVNKAFEAINQPALCEKERGYIDFLYSDSMTANQFVKCVIAILKRRPDSVNSINEFEAYMKTSEGVDIGNSKDYDPHRDTHMTICGGIDV